MHCKLVVAASDEIGSDLEVENVSCIATDGIGGAAGEVRRVAGVAMPFGKQLVSVLHVKVVIAGLKFDSVIQHFTHALEVPTLCDAYSEHGGIPLWAHDGHLLRTFKNGLSFFHTLIKEPPSFGRHGACAVAHPERCRKDEVPTGRRDDGFSERSWSAVVSRTSKFSAMRSA
jgi:hypothetical protein